MGPIEIEGPDGSVVEFPEGTDDATISRVMAETYGGPNGAAASSPPAAEAPAPGGPAYGSEGTFDRSWEGVTDEQRAAYQALSDSEGIKADQPVGSDGNPLLVGADMSPEALDKLKQDGVTFIDREGRWNRKAHDGLGLFVGAARPFVNVGNWVEGGIEKVAGEEAADAFHGIRPEYTTQEGLDGLTEAAATAGFRPGKVGQFAGAAVSSVPVGLLTRNPWLAGAADGALNSNATDAKGLAADTAVGAIAGRAGEGAARMLGSAISPTVRPGLRRQLDAGVTPSPGQLLGGAFHKAEDATTGIFGIGELTGGSQRRARESFNRGGFQRPLSKVGVELPSEDMTTHRMVEFTQDALSDAYDELIPQLDVRLDQGFQGAFRNLDAMARNLNADGRGMWDSFIQNEFAPRFNNVPGPANGRITGESYKELESILSKEVRDFRSSPSPHDRRYASALRELQTELREMAARANPDHAERLQNINAAWRELTVLEDATNRAKEGSGGVFTPDQLGQASRAADPSMRRRAAARNQDLFGEYAEDGADLLKQTVGDPGTAQRGLMSALVGAGFLGGGIALKVNPWAVGALAVGAAPYTRVGNRLFTAAMTQRPRGITDPIREGLDAAAPFVGQGAALAATTGRADSRDNRRDGDRLEAIRQAEEQFPVEEQLPAADLEGLY